MRREIPDEWIEATRGDTIDDKAAGAEAFIAAAMGRSDDDAIAFAFQALMGWLDLQHKGSESLIRPLLVDCAEYMAQIPR